MDSYKFHCSQLGNIMTNGRGKDSMGATCETYLSEVLMYEQYGITKDIKSKYLEKGLLSENASIQLLSEMDDNFYLKNDEFFSNEWICGTPDLVEDRIIDVKSSWNAFTFASAKVTKAYEYQLLGYMWLTGIHKAELVYCLVDTPNKLIEDECKRLAWDWMDERGNQIIDVDSDPRYVQACAEVEQSMTFSQIPKEKRIKRFEIEYKEDEIEKLKKRITECREWLIKNLN